MKPKAVALLSGGLDSTLAIRVLQEQSIEVEAINFMTVFCACTPKGSSCSASVSAARKLGVPLKAVEISEEFLESVKSPAHGYGSQMNPCIDCRILKFKKAAAYMQEIGASFLVTGEVLGQRPMSQRMDAMKLIDREAGVNGLVLRPLCARHMPVTVPEEEGMVDRNRLLAIQGRSRSEQMSLAESFGIRDYPCPAGGCRLTDPGFARRIRDLLDHNPDCSVHDVKLLKLGRHFRMSGDFKLVVGRNEQENNALERFVGNGDCLFIPASAKGPLGMGLGKLDYYNLLVGAQIVARYCNPHEFSVTTINNKIIPDGELISIEVSPISAEELESLRV